MKKLIFFAETQIKMRGWAEIKYWFLEKVFLAPEHRYYGDASYLVVGCFFLIIRYVKSVKFCLEALTNVARWDMFKVISEKGKCFRRQCWSQEVPRREGWQSSKTLKCHPKNWVCAYLLVSKWITTHWTIRFIKKKLSICYS